MYKCKIIAPLASWLYYLQPAKMIHTFSAAILVRLCPSSGYGAASGGPLPLVGPTASPLGPVRVVLPASFSFLLACVRHHGRDYIALFIQQLFSYLRLAVAFRRSSGRGRRFGRCGFSRCGGGFGGFFVGVVAGGGVEENVGAVVGEPIEDGHWVVELGVLVALALGGLAGFGGEGQAWVGFGCEVGV